jgi:phytoene synthase
MTLTLAGSFGYCERLARSEAGNFYHAFRLLPAPQRRAMCALYAFMRVTDDLTDGPGSAGEKQAALDRWRAQLDKALHGQYEHPLHFAFHNTLQAHSIPREYVDAVLDGVEMDLSKTTYSTFAELYLYCYRVASAVGLCCIHIWGCTAENAKVLAEKAGIAFQLTNILRDLREDVARGRVYLPQEDLERFGYPVCQLEKGERNEPFRELMRFEVERARGYYQSSEPLAGMLPRAGRAVYQVMSRTYHGLLGAIEARDFDVFTSRVSLSRWRKLSLVLQAMPTRWGWS